MTKHQVLGLSYKETNRIAEELNIKIVLDMGLVNLWNGINKPEELREMLIEKISKDYHISIPKDAYLFSSDTDQRFEFYIGLMYE